MRSIIVCPPLVMVASLTAFDALAQGIGAVGHSLSGERAYERQVQEALDAGLAPPPRTNGLNIYRAPGEHAEIFDINAGE